MPAIAFFECSRCHRQLPATGPQTVCPACGGLLYVRYDLDSLKERATRPGCRAEGSMWRYANVLPEAEPVTLGEGWTSLLPSRSYPQLLLKEEANNPTGSIRARGLSMAVTMARHYGFSRLAAASTGNTGGALAAFAAAAGIEAHISMPRYTPMANYLECKAYGAEVTLVDGPISDCRRMVSEGRERQGWVDLSSWREPFRIEGYKTLGYEMAEQLNWSSPDAVLCPVGAGEALVGIWKAFEEMEQLGWVSGPRPKMIVVQASGLVCGASTENDGTEACGGSVKAGAIAAALRVAEPDGDYLIQEMVRDSNGTVVKVPDDWIVASLLEWARHEGLLLCPEGAASTAAYDHLLEKGFLSPRGRVVLLNTASALKYTDAISQGMQLTRKEYPKRTPVGGIITPL